MGGNRTRKKRKESRVLGLRLTPTTLETAAFDLIGWVKRNTPGFACFCTVHSMMSCFCLRPLRAMMNRGTVFTDGMPLVWVCRLKGHRAERVYGPDLMFEVCRQGIASGLRHYFYGGAPGRARELAAALEKRFPGLVVAGTCSPGRLALQEPESQEFIDRINTARPDVVWVGLGSPKQDVWMAMHRDRLCAPVLAGVGAAFDFHSGHLRQAPLWMQRSGLEWLFRLAMEPRRLLFRYLIYNPFFVLMLALELSGLYKVPQD